MELHDFWYLTKCVLRVGFVIVTNLYCIPTYLLWMWVFLLPFRLIDHPTYWYIEGILFKWLLCMVASWSWEASYYIVELGDDIRSHINDRCLLVVNHQSTADVPMLMAAFHEKDSLLTSIMWIMDRLFRYTNFGAVSVTHGDYFITQGKSVRDIQMEKLRKHLINIYLGRDRRWVVLFPEGGFFSKRKETSVQYAKKNHFPILEHVTLPRVGAMHVILETLRPGNIRQSAEESESPCLKDSEREHQPLKWIIDITVGYPDSSKPLDLLTICSSSRPSCITYMHYRCYSIDDVPLDSMESLRDWVYARWSEKDELLDEYYKTGTFPSIPRSQRDATGNDDNHPVRQHRITMSSLQIVLLHSFFIASTMFHCYLLRKVWGLV